MIFLITFMAIWKWSIMLMIVLVIIIAMIEFRNSDIPQYFFEDTNNSAEDDKNSEQYVD